jgi:hypothetical protein
MGQSFSVSDNSNIEVAESFSNSQENSTFLSLRSMFSLVLLTSLKFSINVQNVFLDQVQNYHHKTYQEQ